MKNNHLITLCIGLVMFLSMNLANAQSRNELLIEGFEDEELNVTVIQHNDNTLVTTALSSSAYEGGQSLNLDFTMVNEAWGGAIELVMHPDSAYYEDLSGSEGLSLY